MWPCSLGFAGLILMMLFVTTLHIFLCIVLILVILLQPGKGGDVASAFGGGGSSTLFGPRGPASLLTRATTIVAVLFMTTSIVLAVEASNERKGTGDELQDDIQRFEQEESGAATPEVPAVPAPPVNEAPALNDETDASAPSPEAPASEPPAPGAAGEAPLPDAQP